MFNGIKQPLQEAARAAFMASKAAPQLIVVILPVSLFAPFEVITATTSRTQADILAQGVAFVHRNQALCRAGPQGGKLLSLGCAHAFLYWQEILHS